MTQIGFRVISQKFKPWPDTYSGIQTLVYQAEGIPLVMAKEYKQRIGESRF